MPDNSAQFSVTPIIEDPNLDRGDDLYLSIYFSGYGDIAHNKLHIQFPFGNVFEQGGSEFVETFVDDDHTETNTESASNVGYSIGLNESHFKYDKSSNSPEEFGRIGGEKNLDNNPPLLITLSTTGDARPGDYIIPITFTYEDSCGNVKQDYKEASFHINSWQEENSTLLKRIAAGAAAVTVLSFVGWPVVDILGGLYELLKQAISFYSGILN